MDEIALGDDVTFGTNAAAFSNSGPASLSYESEFGRFDSVLNDLVNDRFCVRRAFNPVAWCKRGRGPIMVTKIDPLPSDDEYEVSRRLSLQFSHREFTARARGLKRIADVTLRMRIDEGLHFSYRKAAEGTPFFEGVIRFRDTLLPDCSYRSLDHMLRKGLRHLVKKETAFYRARSLDLIH